jgi:hypothetical protein
MIGTETMDAIFAIIDMSVDDDLRRLEALPNN